MDLKAYLKERGGLVNQFLDEVIGSCECGCCDRPSEDDNGSSTPVEHEEPVDDSPLIIEKPANGGINVSDHEF